MRQTGSLLLLLLLTAILFSKGGVHPQVAAPSPPLVLAFYYQDSGKPRFVEADSAQSPPLVLAFYYGWYDEKSWSPDRVADMPVQPYASRERSTIERQVREARQAGIDAFVMSWYGPREKDNQTETNFRTLLDVAQAQGFRATVDFETTGPFFQSQQDVVNALSYLLSTHARHPAFLRWQGKPVVFFWRQQRFSVETWAAIREQVDPQRESLWIAEGTTLDYLPVFDGLHLYNITWDPPTDPRYTANKFRRLIDDYNARHGTHKLWVATVMPGYDDTKARDREHRYRHDRRDGAYYVETWQAAIGSHPDWIIITSYNEWVEGTQIEPSVTYGDLYLRLTREWAARFKSGAVPQPTDTPSPVPSPTATPAPTVTFTPTATPSPHPTATFTPTATPTLTPTSTPTHTATPTPSATSSPSPTLAPTATPSPSPAARLQDTPMLPPPTPPPSTGQGMEFCKGLLGGLPLVVLSLIKSRKGRQD